MVLVRYRYLGLFAHCGFLQAQDTCVRCAVCDGSDLCMHETLRSRCSVCAQTRCVGKETSEVSSCGQHAVLDTRSTVVVVVKMLHDAFTWTIFHVCRDLFSAWEEREVACPQMFR